MKKPHWLNKRIQLWAMQGTRGPPLPQSSLLCWFAVYHVPSLSCKDWQGTTLRKFPGGRMMVSCLTRTQESSPSYLNKPQFLLGKASVHMYMQKDKDWIQYVRPEAQWLHEPVQLQL